MRMRKALACALALCLSLLPAVPLTANAATADAGKAIQLGADCIDGPSGGAWDYVYFGTYKQSSDGSGGYNTDPVKWRVLSNSDGKLFLLSDRNLDVFEYHKEYESVTWETSTMRSWLNGLAANQGSGDSAIDYASDNFLDNAFSAEEQAAIADTEVVNDDNPDHGTGGGSNTTDKIFLLSIAEAKDSSYFADDGSRVATNTAYVAAVGKTSNMYGNGEADYWWLRSPGKDDGSAAEVTEHGGVASNGGNVNRTDNAVRPAFNLDLSSVLFTSASDNSGHNSSLAAPADYSGSEWKLTLKDSNDFSIGASVAGSTVLKIGYEATALTISHAALSSFTGAGYTNVTAMLADANGSILYYGSINAEASATSSTVTVPAGLAAGEYTLSVYGEDWNDKNCTDYATGTPIRTKITVENWKVTWSNDVGDSYEQYVELGATITVPTNAIFNETMRKGGYDITGWTSSNRAYGVGSAMPAEDLTLTAQYAPAKLTGTVTVSGTAEVGETLTATVTGTNNTGELSYQWCYLNDDPIDGATSSTHEVTLRDAGKWLYCTVESSVQTGSIQSGVTSEVIRLSFKDGDIAVAGYSGAYDGLYHGITVDAPEGAKVSYSAGSDYEDYRYYEQWLVKDAGDCTVYYRVDKIGYNSAFGSAEVKIDKAPLYVEADALYAEVGDACPTPTYTIAGFVNGETAKTAGITGTPKLSYSETPDMSKTGYYSIDVSTADMSATNYDFYPVNGSLTVLEHVHDFTGYAAEGDTVYGTCSKDGCPGDGKVKLLTIVAPENAVYEEGTHHTASLVGHDPQAQLDSDAIVYTRDGAEADPVDVGTYTASYTYEGVTASVTYSIAQRVVPSAPSAPPATEVTVPISGDDATIHVEASVSDGKAVVDDVDLSHLDAVIGDHVENVGTVTIDFSSLKTAAPVTAVEIPADAVKAIAEAVNDPANDARSLEIVLSDGTSIEFDAEALGQKAAQADGLDITISIEHSEDVSTLTPAQREALGGRPAYDINVTSGGEHISDMGGKVSVHAPYELAPGEAARGIVVWYVDDEGNRERCETSYDPVRRRVNWKTDHLSLYMIGYEDVLGYAECAKDEPCPVSAFSDAKAGAWYHDGVHWALDAGVVRGYSNGLLGAGDATTRAQALAMLHRLEGEPEAASAAAFADVDEDAWYAEPAAWAQEAGIVRGYGDGEELGAEDPLTREQLATILYRYAQLKGMDVSAAADLGSFADGSDVSSYAVPAVRWAVAEGIIRGYGDGSNELGAGDAALRGQVATMLMRFAAL